MKFFSTRPILGYILPAVFLCASYGVRANENCFELDSQTEMNRCTQEAYESANNQLEDIYRTLVEKSTSDDVIHLQSAKKAWMEYRKHQCVFNNSGTDGGSIHPMVMSLCYTRLTDEYAEILQEQLRCEEGDVSCTRR